MGSGRERRGWEVRREREGRRGKVRGGKEGRGKGKGSRRDGTTPNKKAGYRPVNTVFVTEMRTPV